MGGIPLKGRAIKRRTSLSPAVVPARKVILRLVPESALTSDRLFCSSMLHHLCCMDPTDSERHLNGLLDGWISRGANIDSLNEYGLSVLHHCIRYDRVSAVEFLLRKGASLATSGSVPGASGQRSCLLAEAVQSNRHKLASLLLEHGAQLSDVPYSSIAKADLEMILILVQAGLLVCELRRIPGMWDNSLLDSAICAASTLEMRLLSPHFGSFKARKNAGAKLRRIFAVLHYLVEEGCPYHEERAVGHALHLDAYLTMNELLKAQLASHRHMRWSGELSDYCLERVLLNIECPHTGGDFQYKTANLLHSLIHRNLKHCGPWKRIMATKPQYNKLGVPTLMDLAISTCRCLWYNSLRDPVRTAHSLNLPNRVRRKLCLEDLEHRCEDAGAAIIFLPARITFLFDPLEG